MYLAHILRQPDDSHSLKAVLADVVKGNPVYHTCCDSKSNPACPACRLCLLSLLNMHEVPAGLGVDTTKR